MPRIIIKDLKPGQVDRKRLLWSRLMSLNLLVYKLQVPNRNSLVIISNDEVIERLLTDNIKENLSKDGYQANPHS